VADRYLLVVTRDLMLQSRVVAAARSGHLPVRTIAGPPAPPGAALALVDCNEPGPARLDAISVLRRDHPALRILAVCAHVDRARRAAALAAGADRCVTNSALVGVVTRSVTAPETA